MDIVNLEIMRAPSNWFLVAFVMALLVFVTYITKKGFA